MWGPFITGQRDLWDAAMTVTEDIFFTWALFSGGVMLAVATLIWLFNGHEAWRHAVIALRLITAARAGALPAANGNCVTAITSRDRGCEYFSLSQDWAAEGLICAALKRQRTRLNMRTSSSFPLLETDWTSN